MPAISFLIADPSPAVQTFIRKQLETYGFDAASIKTVATPQAAREAAAEIKPDFLLTDTFAKEGMSGIGLHRAVQKHNPDCSFAMLGTAVTAADQEEATRRRSLLFAGQALYCGRISQRAGQSPRAIGPKTPADCPASHGTKQGSGSPSAQNCAARPARSTSPETR